MGENIGSRNRIINRYVFVLAAENYSRHRRHDFLLCASLMHNVKIANHAHHPSIVVTIFLSFAKRFVWDKNCRTNVRGVYSDD